MTQPKRAACLLAAGISAVIGSLAAGCGAQRPRHLRPRLTIYTSEGPGRRALDVIDAQRLALGQIGNKVGDFTLALVAVNGATPSAKEHGGDAIAAMAQRVAHDRTAVGYIADSAPAGPQTVTRILDTAGVLQIDPGWTWSSLPSAPSDGRHPRLRAVLGPSQAAEADAEVKVMSERGRRRLVIATDGTAYGRDIARAVSGQARRSHVEITGPRDGSRLSDKRLGTAMRRSTPDAIFVGGLPSSATVSLWDRLAAACPRCALFGPSALDTDQFARAIDATAQQRTLLDEPGFAQADLSPAAQSFVTEFRATYGHPPPPRAFFAYAAVQAIAEAIHLAGGGSKSRARVARAVFSLRNVPSALGTYSIDAAGAATSAPSFLFSSVRNARRFVVEAVTLRVDPARR